MKRTTERLSLWVPTGRTEQPDPLASSTAKAAKLLSDPLTYASLALAVVCAAFYFGAAESHWTWSLAFALAALAVLCALVRRKITRRPKLVISKAQARHNAFADSAMWLPNRYRSKIDLEAEHGESDREAEDLLYRHIGQAVVSLSLFERTGEFRTDPATGRVLEKVRLMSYHARLMQGAGLGYVLMEPFGAEKERFAQMDEGVVHRALRDCGLVDWDVEKVSYDDDVALFILRDASRSRAFDLTDAG